MLYSYPYTCPYISFIPQRDSGDAEVRGHYDIHSSSASLTASFSLNSVIPLLSWSFLSYSRGVFPATADSRHRGPFRWSVRDRVPASLASFLFTRTPRCTLSLLIALVRLPSQYAYLRNTPFKSFSYQPLAETCPPRRPCQICLRCGGFSRYMLDSCARRLGRISNRDGR